MKPLLCLAVFCAILCAPLHAGAGIKVLKVAVTNPANDPRTEDVVLSVAALKRVAADFKPGSVIVTATDAATMEEDARTMYAAEIPSQADDLDGDGKYDEIAFQVDLKPKQTRIVSISYGDPAAIA